MQRGDLVIVLADVLEWGVGMIRHIRSDGQICVEFDDGSIESFAPFELEDAEAWKQAA